MGRGGGVWAGLIAVSEKLSRHVSFSFGELDGAATGYPQK